MKSFYDFYEEAMAAPTNSVGGGQIAGTVEAGDNPPVKKKKRYIYQRGLRKNWMKQLVVKVNTIVRMMRSVNPYQRGIMSCQMVI